MEKLSDREFEQQVNDLMSFIWTPDAVQRSKAKREKTARDKSLWIIENKKIDKEYKL